MFRLLGSAPRDCCCMARTALTAHLGTVAGCQHTLQALLRTATQSLESTCEPGNSSALSRLARERTRLMSQPCSTCQACSAMADSSCRCSGVQGAAKAGLRVTGVSTMRLELTRYTAELQRPQDCCCGLRGLLHRTLRPGDPADASHLTADTLDIDPSAL